MRLGEGLCVLCLCVAFSGPCCSGKGLVVCRDCGSCSQSVNLFVHLFSTSPIMSFRCENTTFFFRAPLGGIQILCKQSSQKPWELVREHSEESSKIDQKN